MKCCYCGTETNRADGFCTKTCKVKFRDKENEYFNRWGLFTRNPDMSKDDKKLQEKFLKKIGKREAKKRLVCTGGVL